MSVQVNTPRSFNKKGARVRTNFRASLKALACALPFLVSCSTTTSPTAAAPGSDRDEQGCIPSAGYRWCPYTKQCERPFELSMRLNFPNTLENFDHYCTKPRLLGN